MQIEMILLKPYKQFGNFSKGAIKKEYGSFFLPLYFFIFVYLSLIIFSNQLIAQNLYVHFKLTNGISFDLPKNWRVIDSNTRTTLDASVAARHPVKIHSSLPFAANLYNSNNQTIGIMNIRVYPTMDVTQNEVVNLNSSSLNEFNKQLRSSISNGVKLAGGKLTEWYGTEKVNVNGKVYLLSKYKRQSAFNPNLYFKVNLLRLLDGQNSFTLTLSYEEKVKYFLKPIIDKIRSSIQKR
jgi:hypothetical protein|tara:strand:- start:185 stop:898 length:714 start_codon:yes stop_codon:yes gene_type:complete